MEIISEPSRRDIPSCRLPLQAGLDDGPQIARKFPGGGRPGNVATGRSVEGRGRVGRRLGRHAGREREEQAAEAMNID